MKLRSVARAGLWGAITVTALATLSAQQTGQRPVFRGGANFVLVDAYPTRGDEIVEGLTAADFQVFEDGKPQKIEAFEFVRVDRVLSESERRDPNNQREVLDAAADPHNRVFAISLDISHVTVEGSHAIRRPLFDALNRIIAPNDLFGVTTTYHRARDLVLGRRLVSLEADLAKYWAWGERNSLVPMRPMDPREEELTQCFHTKWQVINNQVVFMDWMVADGPVKRFFDEILIERLREDRTLTSLEELVDYLGQLREARTVLMPITDGWVLFEPNRVFETEPSDDARTKLPGMPSAKALLGPKFSKDAATEWQKCLTEMNRLVALDHPRRFRALIERANRRNVSFYPVRPAGLAVFDGGGASERVILNKYAKPTETVLGRDMDRMRNRVEGLRTLAEATDGLAVVESNDLAGGLKRVVNDVSAYYLLGYSSTNAVQDNRYRRIEVKVAAPNVRLRARRGYVAAPAKPLAAVAEPAAAAAGVTDALGALARLKPGAEIYVQATVAGSEVSAVIELSSDRLARGAWPRGATVAVEVADAAGSRVGEGQAKIEPGARATLVRVGVTGAGPWRIRTRVLDGIDGPIDDRQEISADRGELVGPATVYRATPAPASPLRPVADFQYRRTERVHLEWPVLGPLERREARLLGRNGQPLAVPVTLSDRDANGKAMLAADVNLAPLSAGEYVIELTIGRGEMTEKKLVAVRVLQ